MDPLEVAEVLAHHYRVAWARIRATELTVDGRPVRPEGFRDLAVSEPGVAVAAVAHLERTLSEVGR